MNRILFLSIAATLSVLLSGTAFAQLAPRNSALSSPSEDPRGLLASYE